MRRLLPLVISGALLLACKLLPGTGDATKAQKSFGGKWKTNWGVVELEQTGDAVDGTYRYEKVKGTITGNVENDTLFFTWTEVKAGKKAEGVGYFVLKKNGTRIEGEWGQGTAQGDLKKGIWKGKRMD